VGQLFGGHHTIFELRISRLGQILTE
jgi:hypothetical protein